MDTVKHMLVTKGQEVWSITAGETVYDAVQMMAEKEVGALPVLNESGRLSGIISERDYARKIILKNKSSRGTEVGEIMTSDVISVDIEDTVDRCMALMNQKKFRHLPVLENDKLVGVITVGDVLKFVINKQTEAIEELENYIMDETGGSG